MATELRVGQLVARYLPVTENWIHTLVSAVPDTSSLVLNRGVRENADQFPSHQVSLADLSADACGPEAGGLERNGVLPTFLEAAREFGCRVLHAHFGTEGAIGLPLARALDVPLVTSFYGFDASSLPRDKAWKRPLADLFAGGTLFCAEGPVLAQRLVALGAPADRVRLMPLPVPPPSSEVRDAPGLEILICARFVDKKGVDDALRAVGQLRKGTRRPFRCTVVGDGPQRAELERLTAELGLNDRVSFAGCLNPADVRSLLARTSIVLQMSRTAPDGDTEGGAPVILCEAMAYGVPCVATHHADIPHVVQHGRTGLLVPERDWRAAAEALASLAASARRRRGMSVRAREIASTHLAPETCGRRLRACYEEALWRHRQPKRTAIAVSAEAKSLAINLRIRSKDVAALRNTLRRALTLEQRTRVLRALAVQASHANPAAAARLLRQARLLRGAESSLALEEARAWIGAQTPARAAEALCAFLKAHSDQAYAWAAVCETALAEANMPSLLIRVAQMMATAPAHFAARAGVELASGMEERARAELVREGTMLLRSMKGTHDRPLLEMALAELVSGHPTEALAVHRAGLVTTLAQYRVASTLESGSTIARRVSKETFDEIARTVTDPGIRAGAAFHLARLAHGSGATGIARQWARRCVALSPTHHAAAALLRQLELRQAS